MCRQVFDKIITDFEWKVFAILYEGTDSLFRMHRLLERWDAKNHGIFLYHLGTGPSYRCYIETKFAFTHVVPVSIRRSNARIFTEK